MKPEHRLTKRKQKPRRKMVRRKVAYKHSAPKYDWTAFDALTNAEVLKAARSDPDAQPLSAVQLQRMKRPNAKVIRRALGLSQSEFAKAFGIPIGTLRDWNKAVLSLTRRHGPI